MIYVCILRCAKPYQAILETAFHNNVMRYNEGLAQTCCFSRTPNKGWFIIYGDDRVG